MFFAQVLYIGFALVISMRKRGIIERGYFRKKIAPEISTKIWKGGKHRDKARDMIQFYRTKFEEHIDVMKNPNKTIDFKKKEVESLTNQIRKKRQEIRDDLMNFPKRKRLNKEIKEIIETREQKQAILKFIAKTDKKWNTIQRKAFIMKKKDMLNDLKTLDQLADTLDRKESAVDAFVKKHQEEYGIKPKDFKKPMA